MWYWSGLVPEPKVKPQFRLTQGKVAILIDDPFGLLPRSEMVADLHAALVEQLLAHKASGPIVPYEKLAELERREPDFERMSIRQIGERIGAEQVLHVTIRAFSIGPQAELGVYKGLAKAAVKVCTTARRRQVRLWPTDEMGHPVEVRQPIAQGDSAEQAREYAGALIRGLAARIAMLFYEHPEGLEQELTAGRRSEIEAP